ncbi:MAG: Eco57I restriction-modification methylase domain-containing protein [Promethearchaeota archaeon]
MNIQKEGIVYTPEKITDFITNITVSKFLIDKLNNKFSTKLTNIDKLFENYIQEVNFKKFFINIPINENDREKFEYVIEILKSLTILDPAVGKGHFLISVLKVLEKFFHALKILELLDWTDYKIREYIISNTLYGVDIEDEAIKNTKKRLLQALTDLVKDTNSPYTLPNIDSNYKIGNAIIGFTKNPEIKNPDYTDLTECFYNEIKCVFQTHMDLKKTELNEKKKKEMFYNLKPFHWFLEFPDVMLKGGFDIIIQNPPYISNRKLTALEKAIFEKRFKTPKGLMNTFGIFIERSIELCHSSSKISNIVHKNLIRSNNYYLIRKLLLKNTTIEEIIDVGAGAFQSITAETVIIIVATRPPLDDHKILIKIKFPYHKCFSPDNLLIKEIPQKIFLEQENYNINLNLQYEELEIINFMKRYRDSELRRYFEAKTCIATGNDKKFLTNHKMNDFYKKTLRGKNIGRFYMEFDNLYVYYNPKMLHRARNESIFLKPEKLIMQTISSDLTVAYDDQNYYPLSTCISIIPKEGTNKDISIKYLLLLMNSKLMNFYYDFVFNLGAHLTIEISVNNINKLPVMLQEDYRIFNILSEIMIILNSKTLRKQSKKYISFFEELINLVIYEVVFIKKFQLDGLNICLINRLSQYLIDMNLSSIEKIQECIVKIQNDQFIYLESQKIKNHLWVKIIEKYFAKNG